MYEQMKKDLLEALKSRLPDSFKIVSSAFELQFTLTYDIILM